MRAAEIIERANEQGVKLVLSSTDRISARGIPSAIDRWLPVIRERKAELIANLKSDRRRTRVVAMLQDNPGKRYAFEVVDEDADPVVVAIAIRNIANFELEIPQAHYNGMTLLEIIDENAA